MRTVTSIEVNEPCPDCRGTGHSGNLHDETCSTCSGGRRLFIDVSDEERRRYREDHRFRDLVSYVEELFVKMGLTHADLESAVRLAVVNVHERRRQPDRVPPLSIRQSSSLAEFINRPNALQEAAGVWPRTKRFIDTDTEWP